MKFFSLIALLTTVVTVLAVNWSPEDYEIFNLRDKIVGDLGEGTTFYSWLNLPKGGKSTLDEINKAYKKVSRRLHPDKFHKSGKTIRKQAEDRFQRLSLVGNILRDPSLKERYDYFLKNGFPTLKGSSYLYSRFRPGTLLTFSFLFVIVGIFHFVSLKISRRSDFNRVVNLKQQIKAQAWNNSLVPPADGSDRKIGDGNGREFIVNSLGEVSLVERDEQNKMNLILLDENEINVNIGFQDSIFWKFPVFLYNKSLGRVLGEIKPKVFIPPKPSVQEPEKPKKKKAKGEKIELPNGKVIYGRKRK